MHHLHIRKSIEYSFAIIFIILLFYLGSQIGFAQMADFIKSHLLLSLIIYFLYCIVSNLLIFLPLVPLWPIMVYLYGFPITITLTIVGTLVAASLSFYMARLFGKKFVMKMMGKHLFSEVEHIAGFKSMKNFTLMRILGNNYYDIISYMAGLSKLTFQAYFLITTIVTVLWTLGLFYLIEISGGINNIGSVLSLLTVYAVIVLLGTTIWEIYHKEHLKR